MSVPEKRWASTRQAESEANEWGLIVHPVVFTVSAALIVLFVLAGMVFTKQLGAGIGDVQAFLVTNFGWFYILTVGIILLFVAAIALTPYGSIPLGPNGAEPEFGYPTWFAMLFSAGMGIGLLFFSVAEPIIHYTAPPQSTPETVEAAREAFRLTFFHWGLHPWAVYSLVGLSLAYFSFRRGLPLTVRSMFHPLLGDRIHGPIGNVIDVVAVVGTLFGVATSLGLGVMQVNAGLGHVFGLAENTTNQVFLIAGITAIATISVVSGLNVGIRRLSEANIGAGFFICAFVLIAGPTVFLAKLFVQNLGEYLQALPRTTLWTATYRDSDWQGNWTIFYWGWWIAWSPFVGMFIARISRGRTIREFIIGTLLAPTLATFAWLTIFGGSAVHTELRGDGGIAEVVSESVPLSLFALLEQFPFASVMSTLAVFVVVTFFVTSSDSGSLVIDIITSGGHPDPPIPQRVFWAVLEGVVAAVLLVAGGAEALTALQTASITTALPLALLLLVLCVSLLKGLGQERAIHPPVVFETPEPEEPGESG